MNNIRFFITILFVVTVHILMVPIFSGCASFTRESLQIQDYSHVGFLSDHVFQFSIRAEPDKSIQGLVDRRSSSLANAEINLHERMTRIMADYLSEEFSRNKTLSHTSADEIRNIFMSFTGKYNNLGRRVVEYYDEDESVVLIYQIKRNNLKSEFESLQMKVFNDYNSLMSGDK